LNLDVDVFVQCDSLSQFIYMLMSEIGNFHMQYNNNVVGSSIVYSAGVFV